MNKQNSFFLPAVVLLLFFLPAVVSAQVSQDSLYSRILSKGAVEMSCNLSYPVGSSVVNRDFGGNAVQLKQLDHFLYRALFDTLVAVKQVELVGYCSIEGTYAANERLAVKRANSFLDYLDKEYSLTGRYDYRVDAVAEDWELLRRLIAASAYPWRDRALRVIDGVGVHNGREQRLMALDGGVPYREMASAFFPQLRRVEIKINYDVERTRALQEAAARRDTLIISQRDTVVQIQTTRDTVVQVTRDTLVIVKEAAPAKSTKVLPSPLLSVKTNLFSWAGLTPGFKYRRFTPNLAVEGFFARRWSAVLSGTYANWSYGGDKKWGVSALSLEPRFWLKADGTFRYAYVGAFGQWGDYNDRHDTNLSSVTGDYWQTGLSVGCYVPIVRGLGVEFGVRGGYESRDESTYSVEDGHRYRDGRQTRTRWGVMGVNVSVSYRF